MSWLYESRRLPSDRNGSIVCRRLFGRWKILVDRYDETSHYMTSVLVHLLQTVPKYAHPRTILLLGLGGGGIVPYLLKKYPTAHLTIVEWDARMIECAHMIGTLSHPHRWTLHQGDAAVIIQELSERYDLIIFDLFKGQHIVGQLLTEYFCKGLAHVLRPGGILCVNAFCQPEFFNLLSQVLFCTKRWRFQYNHLAAFRHHGTEELISALPDGYQSHRNNAAYLQREASTRKNFRVIEKNGVVGLRWHHGFMHFEKYFGDTEPHIDPNGPKRMVIWQRERTLAVPRGWKRPWISMDLMMYGFSDAQEYDPYWKGWSAHAQRHRKKWHEQQEWELFEPSPEQFYEGYKKAKKDFLLKTMMIDYVKKFVKRHRSLVHFLGARRIQGDVPIEAGFAYLDIPEAQQSLHLASYILETAKASPAGVGLMDEWFATAQKRGVRFLDFGVFRQKGEPRSWRGFTRFKGQFNIQYLKYPPALVRWTGTYHELINCLRKQDGMSGH